MLTRRMAMRRMNEMWRRMALTLVFCVLLFHTCQGETPQFSAIETSTITNFTNVPGNTQPSSKSSTVLSSTKTTDLASTVLNDTDSHQDLTTTEANKVNDPADSTPHDSLQNNNTLQESPILQTDTTTTTERAQESIVTSEATTNQIVVHDTSEANASPSVEPNNETQQSKETSKTKDDQESSPSQGNSKNVFWPILVCGLILAAALIGLYVKRNQCPTRASGGIKLADESCMADEDNQGNTLVSVAPLNPPENQEKPSLNGESLEAVKIQNPPAATNGHSTAKADTEL